MNRFDRQLERDGKSISTRALTLVLLVFMSGCIEERASNRLVVVRGNLTLDGEPINEAKILFIPTDPAFEKVGDRPMATAVTDSNGDFSLTTNGQNGAVPGWHSILVSKLDSSLQDDPTPNQLDQLLMDGQTQPNEARFRRDDELFPAYYNYETRLRFKVPPTGPAQADLRLSIYDRPIIR